MACTTCRACPKAISKSPRARCWPRPIHIKVTGKGGHGGAGPHKAIDSILIAAQIVNALQSIVARNVDPLKSAVISVCAIHGGTTFNVIPETVEMLGTVRTLDPEIRDLVEKCIVEVVEATARAYGGSAEAIYERKYPVTMNHPAQAAFAADVAREIAGGERVNDRAIPLMGGEDFAYMLEARPGAFIFVGNGDSAGLHHPAYNFNDEAIVYGTSFFIKVVENTLAA